MWVFLNDAALSIVQDRRNKKFLRVRSRVKDDIARVFPNYPIITYRKSDYRFHCIVPRTVVAAVIADEFLHIDYDNFKDSVPEKDRARAYMRVWATMFNFGADRDAEEAASTIGAEYTTTFRP